MQAVGALQLHPALVVRVDQLVRHGVVHHRLVYPLVAAEHHLFFVIVFFRRTAGSGVSQSESIPLGNQSGGHVGGQQAGGKQAKTWSETTRRREEANTRSEDQGTEE